jgi:Spy/CpxP family protein refolding chaperone
MGKILAILLMASTVLWAQPRGFGGGFECNMYAKDRPMEKLNLTADQQKQFDKLKSDMEKKQIDLRAKVQQMRLELRDLYNEDSPNKTAIESKMSEVSKLQNDMKMNHVDFWFAVNKILTPEQQKIWKEHQMSMGPMGMKGMRDGDGRHMRMGRPGRGMK